MVTNKKILLLLLLVGIGSIGSLSAMGGYEDSDTGLYGDGNGYEEVTNDLIQSAPAPAAAPAAAVAAPGDDFGYEAPGDDFGYEAPVDGFGYEAPGDDFGYEAAAPAAAAVAAPDQEFLDEPKMLALDSDFTFLSKHCGGHPMAHLDTAISVADFPRYVATLTDLHKHFSEVVIITRGIKTETEEFLRAKNLLRPGLIDRVYGASDRSELNLSGKTYWPARKVTFLEELMREKNVKSKASMYFYDDEKANVEMAGEKGFVNAYQAYADNPRNSELPYKRFRRGNGVALLQDILEDMETNCAICMAPLSEEERFGNTACCKKDLLHKNCLAQWTRLKRQAECPLCRGIYQTGRVVGQHYPNYHGREGYEASQYILPPVGQHYPAYHGREGYEEPQYVLPAVVRPAQAAHNDNAYEEPLDNSYEEPIYDFAYEAPLYDFDSATPVAASAAVQAHSYEEPVDNSYEEPLNDFVYELPPVQPAQAAQVPVAEVDSNVNEEAEAAVGAYENITDVPDEYQTGRRYTSEEQAFLDSIRSRQNALKQERDRKRAEEVELAQARGRKAPVALPRSDRRRIVPAMVGEDSDFNKALDLSRQDEQRREQQNQREEDEIQEAIQRSLEGTVRRSNGRTHSRYLGSANANSGL